MIFDLHTHTDISPCGEAGVHSMLDTAASIGLDGFCITDHQTMAIRHSLQEGRQVNGVVVIFGMEYATPDGDFLIFGPYEQLDENLSAFELLTHVRQTGGVAVAAHPFRTQRPVNEKVIKRGWCRHVETINGRNTEIENLRITSWQNRYQLIEIGGSDAHTTEELGRIVTRFNRPIESRQDLIEAIKQGECRPEWRQEMLNSRVVSG